MVFVAECTCYNILFERMEKSKLQFRTKLQQIEELKNWNKQQQRKCLDSKLDPPESNTKQNKFATTQNYSKDKEISLQNFDEVPIKVSHPKYNDCLDILPLSAKATEESQTNSLNPKFKFLKRGEGIARFRMRPIKIKKNTESFSPANKLSLNLEKRKDVDKPKACEIKITKSIDDVPNLEPPDVKLDFRDWKKIFSEGKGDEFIERAIENNRLDVFNPDMSIDSSTASIIERIISVGRRHLKERKELTVFEALEQHVLDSSFNSSSSYVTKMMEQAVISTPVKKGLSAKTNEESSSDAECRRFVNVMMEDYINQQTNNIRENVTKPLSPLMLNLESVSTEVEDNPASEEKTCQNESLHVRFADQVDFKSFVEFSKSFNSSGQESLSKESNEKEEEQNEEQEEWKEGDCDDSYSCSGCSSTGYSSSDDDVRPITPPETYSHPQMANAASLLQTQTGNCPKEKIKLNDLETPNVNQAQIQLKHQENDEIHLLKSQLENEIKNFRAENAKLKLLRERLEKERRLFQNEKKKLLKDLEEEKQRNKAYIEEEKQKLSKEKLVFDKYCKSTKNPTREERKEVQALREQLNEMKEELNKKESRWGAAQARVRNQVKSLEEDNNKLKEEVELLRKKSKHLEFLTRNKKGISNTKMIHAINDYLTSAQFEVDNPPKLIVDKGYFEHKSDSVKPIVILNPDTGSIQTVRVISETAKEKNNINILENTYQQSVLGGRAVASSDKAPVMKQANTKAQLPMTENQVLLQKEQSSSNSHSKTSQVQSNETNNNEKSETVLSEGNKEVRYKNGTVKKIDPVTGNEKIFYLNGDVKEKKKDGTVKYYFSESRIWQTNLPDGLEIMEHPNGQVEKRYTDGVLEVVYPNDCQKLTYPDKSEKIFYADGTKVEIRADKKSKTLFLPNGQKEVHTEECIRREYPDGTTKTVYPDGMTQTVYSNGRVRLKDKHGNLIKDSCQ